MEDIQLRITTSPHLHHKDSTQKIMWNVGAALLPAALWGVYVFGAYSALVLLLSVAAAVGAEYLVNVVQKRNTITDGSAFVTGILVGMNMPPSVPVGIPVIASLFAILVVKWTFGGLGRNWMNPALAGRVFVFFSWTGGMSAWKSPGTNPVDGLSGATPLGSVQTALMGAVEQISGPMELLRHIGFTPSSGAVNISGVFNSFGISIDPGYIDMIIGNIGGCIGEVSGLLLIAGGAYLLLRRYANWEIIVSYFVSFALLIFTFAGTRYGAGLFSGDLLFHIFTGGFLMGLFFMSTDMVTSPVTRKGMIVYGAIIGFLTFLIRIYGSFPEGVSLAILLANIAAPLIDSLMQPRIFGTAETKEDKA